MFEFGKGLRRLFATDARPGDDDLSWTELIAPELLAREARGQCTDAGRVSAPRPFEAWIRGAGLWREHARRTGVEDSLKRAEAAAADAARVARTGEQIARAGLERLLVDILRFDLMGGRAQLEASVTRAAVLRASLNAGTATRAAVAAAALRLNARLARTNGSLEGLKRAALALDAAVDALTSERDQLADEVRLERAALALEAGVAQRDVRLLDQAGRELRGLVAAADPDRRPLSRARALTLCAAGLAALASLAGDTAAVAQARILFDAAADQFTADHSPLDWTAIQLARAASPDTVPLAVLLQAETLSAGRGLTLGALARDRRLEVEAAAAERAADSQRLERMVLEIRRRLLARRQPARRDATDGRFVDTDDLEWAVDQIGLARLDAALMRRTGAPRDQDLAFALFEAAEIARDRCVPELAETAEALMPVRAVRA